MHIEAGGLPADGIPYSELRQRLSVPIPGRYNITAATCLRWAGDAGRPAMYVPSDSGTRTYTFGDFAQASARFANALTALGVGLGDRVAVALPQSPECGIAHLAIQRLGAVAVPISTLHGRDAIEHRLTSARPRVAIGWREAHEWIADDPLSTAATWIVAGGRITGMAAFDDLLARAAPEADVVDSGVDDPALMIYTSGTTGLPKGALHAQRVVPAHKEPISLAHNFFPQEDSVFWSPADWAWAGGLIDCLFAAWEAGRPIVAWRTRGFDPEATLAMMRAVTVRNAFLPPTAMRLLREVRGIEDRASELGLRSVMTGGERVGEDLIDWCKSAFGMPPNEVFGQTEASFILGNSHQVLPIRVGSLGQEYPRARVEVLDDEARPVAPGVEGEICVHASTPARFLRYWGEETNGPSGTAEWHRTGDLGIRDADGYFWHRGRKDDVILSSGYRIGPAEVENCLSRHPAVRAVAVVGTPDPIRGAAVTAVVELRDGCQGGDVLDAELKNLVRSELAAYETPRHFHYVDQLPRTETGKIRRLAVREQLTTEGPPKK